MLRLLLFLLLRQLLLSINCSTRLERSHWLQGSSSYASTVYNIKLVDNLGCRSFKTVQIGVATTVSDHVAASLTYWRLASSSVFRLGGDVTSRLLVPILVGR